MKVGSLFSGIGGLDLGLERAGHTVVWQSEIDPFCCKVLAKHWPGIPNHGDITAIDWGTVEPVDVLCGGFPCQDISLAGTGQGLKGARSGLWFEFARAISILRPRYVLIENVPGLFIRGFYRVLLNLAAIGYDAEWQCLQAAYFGAIHRRRRVFILAYPHNNGTPPTAHRGCFGTRTPPGEHGTTQEIYHYSGGRGTWQAKPGMDRVGNGVPDWVDRLGSLGNAVVPQVAEYIGKQIPPHPSG